MGHSQPEGRRRDRCRKWAETCQEYSARDSTLLVWQSFGPYAPIRSFPHQPIALNFVAISSHRSPLAPRSPPPSFLSLQVLQPGSDRQLPRCLGVLRILVPLRAPGPSSSSDRSPDARSGCWLAGWGDISSCAEGVRRNDPLCERYLAGLI